MVTKFRKRKKGQGIFFSILISILFLGGIGGLIFSNWRITQKRQKLQTKINNLKKEIQVLEKENTKLKEGISQTEKESYWEEKVREQGYKKPGEEQVVVLPPEKTEKKKSTSQSIWQKILEKLKF